MFFCDIPSFLASCFMKRTECYDITGSSNFQPLPWNLRIKVALEAARGLAFLHGDQAKVIYRDFKTSNILLDSVCLQTILSICAIQMNFYLKIRNSLFNLLQEYNAKLSDFGLAKDGPSGDKSHVSTRVMGTQGYAAPEYLATGNLCNMIWQPIIYHIVSLLF